MKILTFTLILSLPLAAQTLGTFNLTEQFGVSWIDQPIEFRYDGGKPATNSAKVMFNNGTTNVEVPYQWVSSCADATAVLGCITVRGSLPSAANYTWTLVTGAPSASPTNPVALNIVGNNYELTNGLTGVRIPTAASNVSPYNHAPIQGVLLSNGTWTGAGASPNLLYSESLANSGCIGCLIHTPMYTATGYTVTITDQGPMKTVLTLNYTFNRPRYFVGGTTINPAGSGHYTIIVTLFANSKSVIVDEDSDMQMATYLPVYNEMTPDIARVRAHESWGVGNGVFASGADSIPGCGYDEPVSVTGVVSTSPLVLSVASVGFEDSRVLAISGVGGVPGANGQFYAKVTGFSSGQFGLFADKALTTPITASGTYTSGGIIKAGYKGQIIHKSPTWDGYIDITYNVDRPGSYLCFDSTNVSPAYPSLVADYPAAVQGAPWYEEMYLSTGGSTSPVLGFYTGRASKQLQSSYGPSLPSLYSSNSHWITGAQASGIQLNNLLRGPANNTTTFVHRQWALFTTTKADILATNQQQPIGIEQNNMTGVNLSRLYTYQLTYSDPVGGWKWQYISTSGANTLIANVRNGTSLCGSSSCYYTLLNNSGGSFATPILNMWQGNSMSANQTALNAAMASATTIATVLSAGDNHYDNAIGYYQLGLLTLNNVALLNAIIMDSNTSSTQKTTAKAILAFFGSLFWDDDWFPIDYDSGDGLGLTNQIEQYLQYRTVSVGSVPGHPYLSLFANTAAGYSATDFNNYFSSTGSAAGSTHYQGTFFQPLYVNYQNFSLDTTTPINGFVPALSDPKWAKYANWEMSIQTPPEPRFGGSTNPSLGLPMRKVESNGDGNTEADVRTGMLATGLYPTQPAVASNLMWLWQAANSWQPGDSNVSSHVTTEDSQFITTIPVIDRTIPAVAPTIGSINIPGYHSAERFNFGTSHETALWFINGGFYQSGGHRHDDDGQVSIYAHAAPLAIDFNANIGNPSTSGRFMHNSIVYDSEGITWNADNPILTLPGSLMNNPTNTEFASFGSSTTSTGTFTFPTDGTVWTRTVHLLNYNPTYPVVFVADSFSGASGTAGKTLTWNLMATGAVTTPAGSITPTTRFSTGCQQTAGQLPSNGTVNNLASGLNAFNFTGYTWAKHETGGINWDMYILSPNTTQQFLIGDWGHGCQDQRGMTEYKAANSTGSFAEEQHILRVHDTGSAFTSIILPYRKTETPTRTVSQQTCGTQIVQASETTCFNATGSQYTNGAKSILAAYDTGSHSAFGATLSGGPQEVSIQTRQVTWTLNGAETGNRNLTISGGWVPSPPNPSVSIVGNTYTYNYTGGLQAAPVTINMVPSAPAPFLFQ